MRKILQAALLAAATFMASHAALAQDDRFADDAVQQAKKYSGTTLTLLTGAGLGALDFKSFSGPMWEKLTGIKLDVVEVNSNELFTKILQEHRAGTGAYDVMTVMPAWLADLAIAGALEPLDGYIKDHGYAASIEDILPPFRDLAYYDRKLYTLVDDGDVFLMYYRKDLFGDPKHQAAFKQKYGYDLAPPRSWAQFDDIATYFTDNGGGELHGAAIARNPGQLHYYFLEWFRNDGGKLFDTDSMKAQINSPIGVATLTKMLAQHRYMPKGAAGWGPFEVMQEWLAGRLAMTVWWPPVGRWSEGFGKDEKAMSWVPDSKIIGKVGYAQMPGAKPSLALGSGLGLSADSSHKEAAYLLMQWLNSPSISVQRVVLPYSLRDPFRVSHFESPKFRSLWPAAGEYLDILRKEASVGMIDPSIRSSARYTDALIRGLQSALAGKDPKAALDEAAAEWDRITQQVGIDKQRAAYRDWASKPAAYP